MKQGWEIKKLGEIGTFQRGGGFLKSDYVEDGFPCIHYGQIHTRFGIKTFKHLTCIPEQLALSKSKIANNGDIIIAITSEDVEGSCKCTAWMGGYDVAVGGHAAIFRHTLNPAFVAYYFKGAYFQTAKTVFAHGSKVVEIKPNDIATIKIAYPSIEEQEKIVAELDCLSGIIEKKRQQLKELDALAQSIFYEMFGDPVTNEKGWEVKPLGEVCDVRDGTHDSPKYLEYSDYVLVTSKNIVDGAIDFTTINYISEEDYLNINKRSCVDEGDIIMPMIGTIGNPIIIKGIDRKFCIKNVALIKFAQCSLATNIYIRALLDDRSYIQYLQNQHKGGTQKFLALGTIRKLKTPLPPLPLQQTFASKIEAIEKLKELIKQSINEVETLFNSRMQEYFG